jgi:uncharacterized protein (DUF58 family)
MRPTSTGWGAIASGVGLYVLGAILGYPELVVAGAGLLLLVVAGFGWVLRPPSLSIHRQVEPVRVRRGGPALGLVEVGNIGRRHTPRLVVEDRAGSAVVSLELPSLHTAQLHRSTYRLPTDRRGVFAVGPLVVAQADPLGLVARRRDFGEGLTLWVHPRSHPVPAARAGSTVELDGPMDDTAPEGTIAFQGLRPYVVGDDLRLVHWRTTARTGTLMIKKHVDTNRPQVAVLLDDRARSYRREPDFETAVEVVASLVEQAGRAGAPVRLDLISGVVRAFTPTGVSEALDLLAGITPNSESRGSLDRAIVELETQAGGSAAVLVSGDDLADDVRPLDRLSGRYRRVSALLAGAQTATARRIGRLEVCRAGEAPALLALWQTRVAG